MSEKIRNDYITLYSPDRCVMGCFLSRMSFVFPNGVKSNLFTVSDIPGEKRQAEVYGEPFFPYYRAKKKRVRAG
ncbi:TPA: hypothetical protein PPN70_003644 [Serratia rubidaea]|nr:hypothetical protein [Serratia rubidaea]HDJ1448527.1 hypothetical protein [Serratia rubidaea]HDJ1464050.1 hypothetical protein [Serratia rubidaea]